MKSNTKYNIKELDITKYSSLIIIDWDDTLYPTSWVVNNNIDLTYPKMRYKYMNHFKELDNKLSQTLLKIKTYGDVVIITNAMPTWVDLSVSVLPKTKKIINSIEVISARQNYQQNKKMTEWKKYAFIQYLSDKIKKRKYNNIISLGDADYEYNALINLYKSRLIPNKYLKSVKFIKSTNYWVLLEQLKLIRENINNIVKSKRHFDLEFTCK
jgi:hypothetical protein